MLMGVGVIVIAGAVAGATPTPAPRPTTFTLTRVQAEEVNALVGFLTAYNRRDLRAALSYFTTGPRRSHFPRASDCDYRRRKTVVFLFREGVKRWLRQRFADHDHLTLSRVHDDNPTEPVGVVAISYARRTSDTLRKLGYSRGIVPQAEQKLPFVFVRGKAKFNFFALGSTGAPTPNPECALVPWRG